ncbi:hypothetical protein QQF64_023820 [Cirrhinus molitorella]|uniref:LRAT domain-containing protein n=1 Tax=Cirrhinus molitorella TaxID=172907 RepID=A0ABR3NJX6_9TELE
MAFFENTLAGCVPADRQMVDFGDVAVFLKTSYPILQRKLSFGEFVIAFSIYRDILCQAFPESYDSRVPDAVHCAVSLLQGPPPKICLPLAIQACFQDESPYSSYLSSHPNHWSIPRVSGTLHYRRICTMLTLEECKHLMSGTHKEFDEFMESEGDITDGAVSKLREGDLILRCMNTGSLLYHAGIYCGNEEVIEFTAPSGTNWLEKIPVMLFPQRSATVIKESVSHFLNGKFYVFRLRSGIPKEFSTFVRLGMKYNEEYNLYKNNSLHFAMRLLKLETGPLPERTSTSDSKNTRASETQIQIQESTYSEFGILRSPKALGTRHTLDENQLLMSGTNDNVMGGEGNIHSGNNAVIELTDYV